MFGVASLPPIAWSGYPRAVWWQDGVSARIGGMDSGDARTAYISVLVSRAIPSYYLEPGRNRYVETQAIVAVEHSSTAGLL